MIKLSTYSVSVGLSLHMQQVGHQAKAYPILCSMKQEYFTLSFGWDATLLEGYPQH